MQSERHYPSAYVPRWQDVTGYKKNSNKLALATVFLLSFKLSPNLYQFFRTYYLSPITLPFALRLLNQ
jgi:hypothetical protein